VKRSIILIMVVIFGLCLVTAAISATPPAGKITISLSDKKTCTFDHAAHVKLADNCQACHHKDAKGSEQKCTNCHTAAGGKDNAADGKKAFHKQCGDCHKAKGKGPQYPQDCAKCHP